MTQHDTHPARTLLKPAEWAAGHRAALAMVVELDQPDGALVSPFADVAGSTQLLEMLADFDVAPTVVIQPSAAAHVEIPDGMIVDGAAWLVGDAARLDAARAAVAERLDTDLRGAALPEGVAAEGITAEGLWVLERCASPFPQRTEQGTVVLPRIAWWDAGTWFDPKRPSPPSAMLESWSVGLASVRTRGELMVASVSARAAGLPGVVETVQRFLDEAVGAGDVWITNATAIASHVMSETATSEE